MHIPEGLPQFDKDSALVVICGSKAGKAFLGFNGELSELFFIDHEDIKYSDDEGFFGSKEIGGSPENPVDKMEELSFINKLRAAVSEAINENHPEKIYLFAPSEAVPAVMEAFPADLRSKIVVPKEGNYVDRHPVEVLEHITEI